ncbi:hypothetical protein ACIPEN_22285 [Herbaspirillum chlorophenolicum]|uniref:Uncharacterized protein n=1 Tax=Herbaspirillum chlorophenolicum TaxID=211589 RepID=A0ABW8F5J3_9BURK
MSNVGTQLGFDLAQAGAARAAEHADRVHADWQEKALAAFREHALKHKEFTTEDVRLASTHVPAPPEERAWGQVATKARRQGMCMKTDRFVPAKQAKSHGRWLAIWASNITRSAA